MRTVSVIFEEKEDGMCISINHLEESSSKLEDIYAIHLTRNLNKKISKGFEIEDVAETILEVMGEINGNN